VGGGEWEWGAEGWVIGFSVSFLMGVVLPKVLSDFLTFLVVVFFDLHGLHHLL
jgi:hypothetical protein